MTTIAQQFPRRNSVQGMAHGIMAAGIGGMIVSFWFLASNHPLDVLAGAAGFVSGSVLVAAGLISLSIQRRTAAVLQAAGIEVGGEAMNVARWTAHFHANRQNRSEPAWTAPIALSSAVIKPLVSSLEQFQLGDGGGPAYLIARDRERFLAQCDGNRELVDLWFAEEREHARLLECMVTRLNGTCIRSHWSFSVFCKVREWFGVRFELTVLLLTEIVSTVYYRLLLQHGDDPALRGMCRLILRDETGHVAFHRDRMARKAARGDAEFGPLWRAWFRLLGLAAATMLWINHAPGLRAIGATGREYYRKIWRELSLFLARLDREIADEIEGC